VDVATAQMHRSTSPWRVCHPLFRRSVDRHFGMRSRDTALLNYQAPEPGMRLGRYVVPPSHFQYDVHDATSPSTVTLHNGRELPSPASFTTYGFEVHSCPSICKDFRDNPEVLRVYYREMRKLIRMVTGAKQVIVFDHVVRTDPIFRVHSDYTEESAASVVQHVAEKGIYSQKHARLLPKADVDSLFAQHFALFNVWRNISNEPVKNFPLALCDARSVSDSDRLYYEIIQPIYSDREVENFSLRMNPSHKWYYYPGLTKDECLVFRQHDSLNPELKPVFHTAVDDCDAVSDSPLRESIEARALLFFGCKVDSNDDLHCKTRLKNGKLIGKLSPHE